MLESPSSVTMVQDEIFNMKHETPAFSYCTAVEGLRPQPALRQLQELRVGPTSIIRVLVLGPGIKPRLNLLSLAKGLCLFGKRLQEYKIPRNAVHTYFLALH